MRDPIFSELAWYMLMSVHKTEKRSHETKDTKFVLFKGEVTITTTV